MIEVSKMPLCGGNGGNAANAGQVAEWQSERVSPGSETRTRGWRGGGRIQGAIATRGREGGRERECVCVYVCVCVCVCERKRVSNT
jgi:hypothetical protein